MEFPSRKTIHNVVDTLIDWSFERFNKYEWNSHCKEFSIWCLEVSRNTNLKVSSGMTKVAVDFGDDNWVIKIPYRVRADYCKDEAENFIRARRRGVKEFFAPCYYYGKIYDFPIYLQRKIEKDDEQVSEDCYSYAFSVIDREDSQTDEEYSEVVCDYVDNDMDDYDTTTAIIGKNRKLLDFLYDFEINDLHKGNFGYLNGKPVIFDYSGY